MALDSYTRRKLLLAPLFLLVAFSVLEIALRFIVQTDADGNRSFADLRLKPYHLPVKRITELLHQYDAAQAHRKLLYDPDLGWVPNPPPPGSDPAAPLPPPRADTLRVAVFGASYSANWPAILEKLLNDAGIRAEVFNFSVGGYGIDQIYLRWRKLGLACKPNVVVFGFTHHNCADCLTLMRALGQLDSGVPFMKPRFLLENGQIKLINSPTPSAAELPGILSHYAEWPLAAHELHYHPSDYKTYFWRRSVLLSFLEARVEGDDLKLAPSFYDENGEAAQLALKIISQFKDEAEQEGSQFCIVHLPIEADLRIYQDAHAYPFAGLMAAVDRIAPMIRPEDALLAAAHGHDLSRYFAEGHYIAYFNSVVGHAVANALIARPEVARFRVAPTTSVATAKPDKL